MKLFIAFGLVVCLSNSVREVAADEPVASQPIFASNPSSKENHRAEVEAIAQPATIAEARGRAILFHETIAGALQVVHRDFFDDENAHAIPSASLEDVFHELLKTHNVNVRWLIVDTDVVNVDHKAQDEFEKNAAKSLAKGSPRFEATEGKLYRYAGSIRLASQCLKCHVKDRISTDERTAGLLISMPLALPRHAINTESNSSSQD